MGTEWTGVQLLIALRGVTALQLRFGLLDHLTYVVSAKERAVHGSDTRYNRIRTNAGTSDLMAFSSFLPGATHSSYTELRLKQIKLHVGSLLHENYRGCTLKKQKS